MDQVEQRQLKKDSRFVKKEGQNLVFTLLSGKKKHLSWSPSADSETELGYFYRYYLPKMGYFVVERKDKNKSQYLLINDKSGREKPIWGFPKASPNAKQFIVGSLEEVSEYESYGLRIYGFTDQGLKIIWETTLDETPYFKPILSQWIDDQTIQITLQPNSKIPQAKIKLIQLVKDDKGSWLIEEV